MGVGQEASQKVNKQISKKLKKRLPAYQNAIVNYFNDFEVSSTLLEGKSFKESASLFQSLASVQYDQAIDLRKNTKNKKAYEHQIKKARENQNISDAFMVASGIIEKHGQTKREPQIIKENLLKQGESLINLIQKEVFNINIPYLITFVERSEGTKEVKLYSGVFDSETVLEKMIAAGSGATKALALSTNLVKRALQVSSGEKSKYKDSEIKDRAYNLFLAQVQYIQGNWKKKKFWKKSQSDYYNEGNTVEAFRWAVEQIKQYYKKDLEDLERITPGEVLKFFGNRTFVYTAMRKTLKNTAAGLDLGDVDIIKSFDESEEAITESTQLKNQNATIVRMTQILKRLGELYDRITSLIQTGEYQDIIDKNTEVETQYQQKIKEIITKITRKK